MNRWYIQFLPAMAALLRTLQEPQVSCPSTISQKAAEAALTGPRAPIDAMRAAYRSRAYVAAKVATESGLSVVPPHGTIYMLVDVSDYQLDMIDSPDHRYLLVLEDPVDMLGQPQYLRYG